MTQDMGHVLFSLFNVVWASLYLEAWKRYSTELAFRWGTLSTPPDLLEPPRPLYKVQCDKAGSILIIINLLPSFFSFYMANYIGHFGEKSSYWASRAGRIICMEAAIISLLCQLSNNWILLVYSVCCNVSDVEITGNLYNHNNLFRPISFLINLMRKSTF